jgi:hypothetical protein
LVSASPGSRKQRLAVGVRSSASETLTVSDKALARQDLGKIIEVTMHTLLVRKDLRLLGRHLT